MPREVSEAPSFVDLKMLRTISGLGWLSLSEIAELAGLEKGIAMIHLAKLERLGYVESNIEEIKDDSATLVRRFSATKRVSEVLSHASKV